MNLPPKAIARTALVAGILALAVSPLSAQFSQYTPSGEFGDRDGALRDALETAVAAAPWRVGRVRLSPWLALRDIEFLDNVRASSSGNEVSDVTATVGAGVRAYLPLSDFVVAVYALPEYVWWKDLESRRQLNGRYGLGLFGNIGQTDVEITLGRSEESRYFSRQVEERVNVEEDFAEVAVEVPLAGGFGLFGGASVRDITYPDDEAVLEDLSVTDREENEAQLGLRYRSGRGLMVGLLYASSETNFDSNRLDRSNSGDSPVLEILYDAPRYYFQTTLVERSLEPDGASEFQPYEELTGDIRISFSPIPPLELQVLGDRNLVYTTGTQWVYYEDENLGVASVLSLGTRTKLRVFAEQGENAYAPFAGEPLRLDDFDSYGGDIEVKLGRASFRFGARRTKYDSNLDNADREFNVVRVNISIRGVSGSPWT